MACVIMNSGLRHCYCRMTINNILSLGYSRLNGFSLNFCKTLRNYSGKTHYKYKKQRFPKQIYDAFLVLDFESTCLTGYSSMKEQEIIEFPCVWVNGSNDLKIESKFHKYVRPEVYPVIDPFCTNLTGITSEMIENERPFRDVLEEFVVWYEELKVKTKAQDTIFVTDGNWDLNFMLPEQCRLSNVEIPPFMKNWINIRDIFHDVTGKYPKRLKDMLMLLNIRQEGRSHHGMDDTMNIYKIFRYFAEKGHVYK